jgi:hypothetical protein
MKRCGNSKFNLPWDGAVKIKIKRLPILKAVKKKNKGLVKLENDSERADAIAWLDGLKLEGFSNRAEAKQFKNVLDGYPGCDGYVLFPNPKSANSGNVCISWPKNTQGTNYRVGSWEKDNGAIEIEISTLKCTGFTYFEQLHWEDPKIPDKAESVEIGLWPIS